MALTPSQMVDLETQAPDFRLLDPVSKEYKSLTDFSTPKVLVIAFICNHCAYVRHLRSGLAAFGDYCRSVNAMFVAINSNDPAQYPEDSPEKMIGEARVNRWTFPYLFDETQEAARDYHAACTPDFFVFDHGRKLVYRGQFDDSRPGNGRPVTGADVRAAVDAVLDGRPVSARQLPSIGCNIKWRTENPKRGK
jgi:peroxiredoxin